MQYKDFIKSHEKEARDLLLTLAKIPAPSHHEEKRSEFIKNWYATKGIKAEIDEALNVIVKYPGKRDEVVVMAAHIDTVFDDTTEMPMTIDGDIIRCPGVGDDTANVVNVLMCCLYLKENNITPEYTIFFVSDTCEEGLGNLKGTKTLFKYYRNIIKYYYSFDLYIPLCTDTAVGSHRYEVNIKTEGGHSYHDFGNTNAIKAMSDVIEKLTEIKTPDGVTYNFGTIQGGTTINAIASSCTLTYEFRSIEENKLQYMKEKFYETLDTFNYNITVKELGIRPGSSNKNLEERNAFTKRNIEVMERVLKEKVTLEPISSDCNIPLSLGIPSNCIGAITGAGEHTREEWIDITSLARGMEVALNIMDLYL